MRPSLRLSPEPNDIHQQQNPAEEGADEHMAEDQIASAMMNQAGQIEFPQDLEGEGLNPE